LYFTRNKFFESHIPLADFGVAASRRRGPARRGDQNQRFFIVNRTYDFQEIIFQQSRIVWLQENPRAVTE
jgi:hypothetical protein